MKQRNKAGAEKSAADQIYIFATCGNFPKDALGLRALADALESASRQTAVSMKSIVDACATGGAWCPTPYDLLQTAIRLKGEQRTGFAGCEKCGHTGWIITTRNGYDYASPCLDCRGVRV